MRVIIAWWVGELVSVGRGRSTALYALRGLARRGRGERDVPRGRSELTRDFVATKDVATMESDPADDAATAEPLPAIPAPPPEIVDEPTLIDAIAVPLAALLALLALRQLGQLRPPLVAFSLAASGVAVWLAAPPRCMCTAARLEAASTRASDREWRRSGSSWRRRRRRQKLL